MEKKKSKTFKLSKKKKGKGLISDIGNWYDYMTCV